MDGLLRPTHLFFILIIVLVIFGAGDLPKLGEGLGRAFSHLLGGWNTYRGALFMAKGVDPRVGRDVGDMLPDEDAARSRMWFRCLLAILLGNTLYFLSSPFLPDAARVDQGGSSGLPWLVDLWFCVFVFGALNLAALLHRQDRK